MHFMNYNDDRAKNHRIYSSEVLWQFYEQTGLPAPPMQRAEQYPLPEMVDWFPIIAVGVMLLSFMLGGMMNIFMLTHKENTSQVNIEYGLAPIPLGVVFLAKILLALLMGLLTGTVLLGILYFWIGIWPAGYLWAVWLLAALVILFWLGPMLLMGMRARQLAGAIGVVLTGVIVFFIGGGLGLVRYNEKFVPWFSWLFPNTYAVDPLRDLILFRAWPVDWRITLLRLAFFAALSLGICLPLAARRLRHSD
jgi:ABC-type multidrug transport system permease subunit